jgi:hypothetical protein
MKKLNRKAPQPTLTQDLLLAVQGGDGPVLPPDPPDVRAHIIESGK